MPLIDIVRQTNCPFGTNHTSTYFYKEFLFTILWDVYIRLHDAALPIKELISLHVLVHCAHGRSTCAVCDQ